jgi:hypothetical protein
MEPLSSLTEHYTNLFIEKIKNINNREFIEFVAHFYKYVDSRDNDFIVNVNDIWNWVGFTNKENCIRAITKNFKESIDYMVPSCVILTISAFKKLCIQSNTNEGDSVYNYYCKLERCYREVLEEKIYDNYFYS